ncbi:MAG: hypothetical protein NTX79_04925 [Candidatus Micrarchaeota archaeon]|nr:hypothetical protein [Candidatus Micrarchaeota archaeon]
MEIELFRGLTTNIYNYFHSSFNPEISPCEDAIPDIKSETLGATAADIFEEALY